MADAQFPKSVKRIIMFESDASGALRPVVEYDRRGKRRKQSKHLKQVEKAVRRVTEAGSAGMSSYLDRHKRSNEKKKDGWIRDLGKNVAAASKKTSKKLTPDD